MKLIWILTLSLALTSCQVSSPSQSTSPIAPKSDLQSHPTPLETADPSPTNKRPLSSIDHTHTTLPPQTSKTNSLASPTTDTKPILKAQFLEKKIGSIHFSLVKFDDRKYNLSLIDQSRGPGSQYADAKQVGQKHSALAAINAGFFTPEGSPLGRLKSQGKQRGHNNPSSLGSGYLLWSRTAPSQIIRRQHFSQIESSKYSNWLQTGPFLAENKRAISGLNASNARVRSFIAWDGKHHWCLGLTSACSLAELSRTLAGRSIAGFSVHTAINFDGGRSSDLWASARLHSKSIHLKPFWHKPVRNFLILK